MFLSAEQYMSCCDQVWSTDKRSTQKTSRTAPAHGSIVYAKRDHVGALFAQLRRSRSRVVLVTAESDDPVQPIETFPAQVGCWFSTNSYNARVRPLPLGLGNSYCQVTAKAGDLSSASSIRKDKLLYINFRVETNLGVRLPLWQSYDRAELSGWATRVDRSVGVQEYVKALSSHRFVLCPEGNGIDTHRMWEALYVGTIPIVKRHPALECFADLPILFVDSLHGIDRAFLERAFAAMEKTSSDSVRKLYLPFWRQQIFEAKENLGDKLDLKRYLLARLRNTAG